ncbi:uncharacterized protein SCHCODRAFT_02639307 [Schizophyllum commune H4-8]|nr:uncharacterized protein SCHCODRAFT_02639307 [Schizophyllum commune H4-8]KAI5887944.1 hypothetical protein SCHCODRAFT_02639307 [Schizophyllum commune H4-8]
MAMLEETPHTGGQDPKASGDAGDHNRPSVEHNNKAENLVHATSAAIQGAPSSANVAEPNHAAQDGGTRPSGFPSQAHNQPGGNANRDETPRFFGIPKYTGVPTGKGGIGDYRDMYPEDPYAAEIGENARVWRVYLDESGQFDDDMIKGFRDTLDVHLVFAALFSAVVTTFVVQTSQSLQPDYGRITSAILLELVALQRARSPEDVPSANVTLDTLAPSAGDVWVNALWFTTLGLSLSTVLIAVLVKQWLQEYAKTPPGPPRDRALIRHMRYKALIRWRIPFIIGLVPMLLHVSLALFLAGLIVFLSGMSPVITCVVTALTGTTYIFYIATHILGSVYRECAYRTPISLAARELSQRSWRAFVAWLTARFSKFGLLPMKYASDTCPEPVAPRPSGSAQEEVAIVRLRWGRLDQQTRGLIFHCVSWLYDNATNPSAHHVIAEAFSGWDHRVADSEQDVSSMGNLRTILIMNLQEALTQGKLEDNRSCLAFDRALRALSCITWGPWNPRLPSSKKLGYDANPPMSYDQWADATDALAAILATGSLGSQQLLAQRVLCFVTFHPWRPRFSLPLPISEMHRFVMNPDTKLSPATWYLLLHWSRLYETSPRAFVMEAPPSIGFFFARHNTTLMPSTDEVPLVEQWVNDVLWLVRARYGPKQVSRRPPCPSPSYKPFEEPASLLFTCGYDTDVKELLTQHIASILRTESWSEALTTLIRCLRWAKKPVPEWLRDALWAEFLTLTPQFHATVQRLHRTYTENLQSLNSEEVFRSLKGPVKAFCVISDLYLMHSAQSYPEWNRDFVYKCMVDTERRKQPDPVESAFCGIALLLKLATVLHSAGMTEPLRIAVASMQQSFFQFLQEVKGFYPSLSMKIQSDVVHRFIDAIAHVKASEPTAVQVFLDVERVGMLAEILRAASATTTQSREREGPLRQLHLMTPSDTSTIHHIYMASLDKLHREAAGKGDLWSSTSRRECARLASLARVLKVNQWGPDDCERHALYYPTTVLHLQQSGAKPLTCGDKLVYGPYMIPYADFDSRLAGPVRTTKRRDDRSLSHTLKSWYTAMVARCQPPSYVTRPSRASPVSSYELV